MRIEPGAISPSDSMVSFRNVLSEGTLSWSSQTPDGFAANALGPQTYDAWVPSSLPANIGVTLPSPQECECAAIVAHNLGTSNATARVQRKGASRANLLPWSQDMSHWTASASATNAPNAFVGLDGTMSGALVSATGAGNRTLALTSSALPAPSSAADYFFSLFINRSLSSTPIVGLSLLYSGSGEPVATFNLDTLTVTGAPYPDDVLLERIDDDWFRIGYRVQRDTGSTLATTVSARLRATANSTHAIWGAQLEVGTMTSSYIKTSGSSVSSDWHDVTGFLSSDARNSDIFALFAPTSAAEWRIEVTGQSVPAIGIAWIGPVMRIPLGTQASYTPIRYSLDVEMSVSSTVRGQFVGSYIERKGGGTSISWAPQEREWVQTTAQQFIDHFNATKPFLWMSCPEKLPEDAHYVWRNGATFPASFGGGSMYADISLTVAAYVA